MIKFDNNDIVNILLGVGPIEKVLLQDNVIWKPDTGDKYLTITALEDNCTVTYKRVLNKNIFWSTDQENWTETTANTNTITINAGDKLYIKGYNSYYGNSYYNSCNIKADKKHDLSGHLLSLCYGENVDDNSAVPTDGTQYAFAQLFEDDVNLIHAHELKMPVGNLRYIGIFQEMFHNCTSLETIPALPSTELSDSCYWCMFQGCSAVKDLTFTLPATALPSNCYTATFSGLGIRDARNITLPAASTTTYSYRLLYQGCADLVHPAVIESTTVASRCCQEMFAGCPKVDYVVCKATSAVSDSFDSWLQDTPSSVNGVVYGHASCNYPANSISGVPTNWNFAEWDDYENAYLTFHSKWSNEYTFTATNNNEIYYSIDDGVTWNLYTGPVSTVANQRILWKGNMVPASDSTGCGTFSSTANFVATGNIMSLVKGDDFTNYTRSDLHAWQFASLFKNCTTVTDSQFIKLPTCDTKSYQYFDMFFGCSKMNHGPEILSDKIYTQACLGMFNSCSALKEGVRIEATSIADLGCKHMYQNCTSLEYVPDMKVTSALMYESMCHMFDGCTSLKKAPEVPAQYISGQGAMAQMFIGCTALEQPMSRIPELIGGSNCPWACYEMFRGCSSLQTIPEMPSMILTEECYGNMFQGCTSLVDLSGFTLPSTNGGNSTGAYDAMFAGCSNLVAAPEMKLTVAGWYCCRNMYNQCSSLTTVQEEFYLTHVWDRGCESMFRDCTSLVQAPNMPYATTLGIYAMNEMYWYCTALETGPSILPATSLPDYCYQSMFNGCSALTSAPMLPATTIGLHSYDWMFWGNSSLHNLVALATNFYTDRSQNWVQNISSTGTFEKNASYTATFGDSYIPNGWTVIDYVG